MDARPPTSGRLPRLRPEALDDAQREVYDAILDGPRSGGTALVPLTDDDGGLLGPFNAMLTAPSLGAALQALGSTIRFASTLTPRAREIAILTAAAHWHSDYEIYAHERLGRAAGLSEEELTQLCANGTPTFDDESEQIVADLVRLLLAGGRVPDELYAAAVERLTTATLFELSTLVGYYTTLALQLRLFDVETPGRALDAPSP